MEFDIKVSIKLGIIMTARKITIMNFRKIITKNCLSILFQYLTVEDKMYFNSIHSLYSNHILSCFI